MKNMKDVERNLMLPMCMAALLMASPWINVAYAQGRGNLCAYNNGYLTWTCGAEGSSCTTVWHQGTPTCTTMCPYPVDLCTCSINPGSVPITTKTGTVELLTDVHWPHGTAPTAPFNTGGCNCTFVRWDRQHNVDYYNCLACVTSGAGTPGTEQGQACTDAELYSG
jgi:hypothetical protein